MISRLAIFFMFFSVLQASASTLQAASFALEIQPVKLKANLDGAVTASYSEPCGAEFAGFLYRSDKGGELKVAAVFRRYHARCLGLMGMEEVTLPLVNAENYAAITSINPSQEPLQVKIAPIQNLHFTQNFSQTDSVAVYTSQCGEALGLVVLPEANGMRFAVLEGTTTRPAPCNRATQVFAVAGLEPSSMSRYNLQEPDQDNHQPSYSLRRVPVQLLNRTSDQAQATRYSVYYLRRCNEAPIGLVQQNQANRLQVSMLVAHYEDRTCAEQGPKKIWTAYEDDLTVAHKQSAQGLYQAKAEDLALVRPTSFRWNEAEPTGTRASLEIFALSTCNRDLGLVSRANNAGLAVGILQLQSAEPCNSHLKKVSFSYDMELDPQASRDVKPLQLVGT